MSELAYLLILLPSILGLTLVDFRFRLAWWSDARLTAKVLAISLIGFLIWDIFGIKFDIFSMGESPYITGITIVPNVPIEEPVFLYLLSYQALIFWRFMRRRDV